MAAPINPSAPFRHASPAPAAHHGRMHSLGTIAELWRFPVKSMRGKSLSSVRLLQHGLEGDRRFAFSSTAAPAGKPLLASAERTAMLRYKAQYTDQDTAQYTDHAEFTATVTTPAGLTLPLPSSELLRALQTVVRPGAQLSLEASPEDPFFDVRPVSLVSTATLQALTEEFGAPLDPLRFRSNLVLTFKGNKPFAEEELIGSTLCFGTPHSPGNPDLPDHPQLRLLERIPRCRMVSLDPETTEANPAILRHLARHHGGRLGIYARVEKTGLLRVGDTIWQQTAP